MARTVSSDHANKANTGLRTFLVHFFVLSILSGLLLAYFLDLTYHQTERAAQVSSLNEANLLANQTDSALRRIKSDLEYITQQVLPDVLVASASPANAPQINATLHVLAKNFPEVTAYRVFDSNGSLVFSSSPTLQQISIADRNFFNQIKASPDRTLHFSETLNSKSTGNQILVAYQAILSPGGAFLGVVAAVVDLVHFSNQFSQLHVGEQGMVSIRRSDDRRLIVRWPIVNAEINQQALQTPPYLRIKSGEK